VGVGVMEKGHVYSDLWALDLATYVWTKVKRAGVPPGPRAGFTFAGTYASALRTRVHTGRTSLRALFVTCTTPRVHPQCIRSRQ
jgi:hypothetical protein